MSDKLGKMITNVIEVEKNGVKVVIKQQYNKENHDINIDFSAHDKVFEDKIAKLEEELKEWRAEAREIKKNRDEQLKSFRKAVEPYVDILHMHETIAELKQHISELESKETETCVKEPKISDSAPSREWYENRHQSDCIEINRLNTTIDVLIHKVEYLRQFAGLE